MVLVVGLNVALTEPKLLVARPVVWKRVVMSLPEGGKRWRSGKDRYSKRTW